jgi:RNA polymerase sigma-70 factor (ECF subfamily)
MQLSDEVLMQKVKEGDMRAFDVLVRRWEHRLFNLIYKIIGDYETTKDVRQEVFLRVYQAARRYRPISQFSTWLYRIAINCSINELKKLKRRRMFPLTMPYEDKDGTQQSLANILIDAKPQPDEIIQRNEINECIQNALDRLPDEQRIVIILRHYEGMKFQQIASILDCPLGTVKSRMRYGLEQLRTMLKRSDLFNSNLNSIM